MIFTKFISCLLLALPALAAPAPAPQARASSYWVETIKRQGTVAFGNSSSYAIFRNVMDYGAKGDGSTDDTSAINAAISDGNRCGLGCSSSTTTPAIVYFPAGTYLVSTPLIQYYYTQFIGDANTPPTLKASASFSGMAVIDADPYEDSGANWYVNQDNFYRQVRNFVIDLTAMEPTTGAGIHWQVAQATSLQNIVFNMNTNGGTANAQKGIFMDNGSGGFMSDLTFNGGGYGAFLGSQQFTMRNMTFNNCQTAVFMNWNWAWTMKDITINNCKVGLDMATGGSNGQTVGSVLWLDSTITGTTVGVNSSYSTTQSGTNGSLILQNVDMSGATTAIKDAVTGSTVLAGGSTISNFVQGNSYTTTTTSGMGTAVQAAQSAVDLPAGLKNSAGGVFARSKPQYETVAASNFVSVKSAGAKGDGTTDDTAAIQAVLDNATSDQIVYFDHGAYIVTSTIKVPKDVKITGEIWPLIMASGSNFSDMSNPQPVFQVGQKGDNGSVEMSDLIFQTAGPAPGAIMIEWNLASEQGASGMWDVHNRIGGSAGTDLQLTQCAKNNGTTHGANAKCEGAFMMMHITESASNVYLENTWFWVADHDLEPAANNAQIDIYNGRGVLIESKEPVWLYGTASEHSVLYNYQVSGASTVFMGLIQTETAYFQGNPAAPAPFNTVDTTYNDPNFSNCTSDICARTWGLRVVDSSDVYVYGAGLYSFFDNYNQDCLADESCQQNIVSIENSGVHLFGLSTKASVNMLTVNGQSVAKDSANRNNYCATLMTFTSST